MAAIPLPPKESTTRELVQLARRIARYGEQRRKLLVKVQELDGQIRHCKRMLRELAELVAQPIPVADAVDELEVKQ